MSSPKSGFDAEGRIVSDGFIVLIGSKVSKSVCQSFYGTTEYTLREHLRPEGTVVDGVFVKDYLFLSPSATSSVVKGCKSNGREVWKTEGGKTLGQMQESEQVKDEVRDETGFYTSNPKSGFEAEGLAVPDGFVVLKDSRVSNSICKSFNGCGYHRLRERLEPDGIIVDGVFVKDHLFDSPSAASSVVRGAGSDGLTVWKTKDGETLKQVRGLE